VELTACRKYRSAEQALAAMQGNVSSVDILSPLPNSSVKDRLCYRERRLLVSCRKCERDVVEDGKLRSKLAPPSHVIYLPRGVNARTSFKLSKSQSLW
jgi:hypothetical protein